MALLPSPPNQAGPFQEGKKTTAKGKKKNTFWSFWKHLVGKEMPGQLLPCGNPFHSGWIGAHVLGTWVSQKIHKSLGMAEQEGRRKPSPPQHWLIKQASKPLRWWAGFSKNGQSSKTGEKGCPRGLAWPLCLAVCSSLSPGQGLWLVQSKLVSKGNKNSVQNKRLSLESSWVPHTGLAKKFVQLFP